MKYIEIAGGLTLNAEKKEIWISYPNGNSFKMNRYGISPKVYDGSVITVGFKEPEEPLDRTEFAKETASIISDFLQIALTLTILKETTN